MNSTREPNLSIVIPVYNGACYLGSTLESLLSEEYSDFEVVLSDDCSTDATEAAIRSIADERVRFRRNPTNLGYPGNLAAAIGEARGKLVMLFAQDDILVKGALQRTVDAFRYTPDVGVVTRPYYWFEHDVTIPIRQVPPYDPKADAVLSLYDGPRAIAALFTSFGQLSGLAVRRSLMTVPCHPYVFTAHIAPIAGILRNYQGVFLSDVTVAVRVTSSQTRDHPEIYSPTPLGTWIQLGDDIFSSPDVSAVREQYRTFLGSTNHVGLIQLRNHAPFRILLDEMRLFVTLRPANLVDPRFILPAITALTVPRRVLRPLTDWFKRFVLGPWIRHSGEKRPRL